MKATDLIKKAQKLVDKYGPNLEVYIDAPGFNCSESFNCKDELDDMVGVENLDEFPPELIFEDHGDNKGLIRCVLLIGDESVAENG